MTRRAKVRWAIVAAVFTVVNLAGAVFAGLGAAMLHASSHVALAVVGACVVWWLAPNRSADAQSAWGNSAIADSGGDRSDRLTNLEQSVDAVAVEVERIGEGQRYMTRMLSEQGKPQPSAEEAKVKPPAPPNVRRD